MIDEIGRRPAHEHQADLAVADVEGDVHEVRSAFQGAMQERFVPEIERLSGRRVESFVSTHSVGPDLEIELFFLAPAA